MVHCGGYRGWVRRLPSPSHVAYASWPRDFLRLQRLPLATQIVVADRFGKALMLPTRDDIQVAKAAHIRILRTLYDYCSLACLSAMNSFLDVDVLSLLLFLTAKRPSEYRIAVRLRYSAAACNTLNRLDKGPTKGVDMSPLVALG